MKLKTVTLLLTLITFQTSGQVSVLTQHNDLARTGQNLQETILNTSTVNVNSFGKIFTRSVDDQIYTQPLIVSGIEIPLAGKRNVVYVATVSNTLYAFDADDPSLSNPYWVDSLTSPGTVVVSKFDMTGACGGYYNDFSGNIGIVGTPVIDTITHTLYVVSRDRVISNNKFEQWLHAIDIRDGKEKSNSPHLITASYDGTGSGSIGNKITFDPQKQNQRPALALVNGVIFISWSSHCDWGPYHGWVIGFDTATLQPHYSWMDTPNGDDGGIWMSGQAISADESGNLYLTVGNGSVGNYSGHSADSVNYAECFLKLQPSGSTLLVKSFFIPNNYTYLETYDLDLGSAGVLLIPNTKWAFSGGKDGTFYLVNRDTMGGLDVVDHVLQSFSIGSHEIHGAPVYWKSASDEFVYAWPAQQYLFGYRVNHEQSRLDLPAAMKNTTLAPDGQPGGMLALSANGDTTGTGILWASIPISGNANQETRPGILRAYDAGNLSNQIWNSQMNGARDSVGNFAKFVCPTIANGKVYLSTFSKKLQVYGLLAIEGINSIPLKPESITLFPNPANQSIHFSAGNNIHFIQVEIDDLCGRLLHSEILENESTIDVSDLSSGIYFIKLFTRDSIVTKKLSIER